jgi:hypothetical protein
LLWPGKVDLILPVREIIYIVIMGRDFFQFQRPIGIGIRGYDWC